MSRTLAVTQNITVDGVIEMTDWFDPQVGAGEEAEAVLQEQAARSDALLVGRNTFEAFRSYWPHRTGPVTDHLNQVRKYVVSSTLGDPEWANSQIIGLDDVAALKEADGADIVCTGSLRLTRALVERGLVDEYRLFTYPVAAGTGVRLFPAAHRLRLVESRAFDSGVVLSVYRPG